MYHKDYEWAYLRMREKGECGWGGKRSVDELLAFPLRPCLEALLQSNPPQRLLEVGCGTAPVSLWAARKGISCVGVDIAPAALSMAQNLSAELNCALELHEGDVCQLSPELGSFDWLIDGACLHCLIFDKERDQALESWTRALIPGGLLVLDSLVQSPEMSFSTNFRFDESGILWRRAPSSRWLGRVSYAGEDWLPQRRILPFADLNAALSKQNLNILSSELHKTSSGRPDRVQIVCQKPSQLTAK